MRDAGCGMRDARFREGSGLRVQGSGLSKDQVGIGIANGIGIGIPTVIASGPDPKYIM